MRHKIIYFTDFIFIQYTEILSHLITVILEIEKKETITKKGMMTAKISQL